MERVGYQKLEERGLRFWGLSALYGVLVLAGLGAAYVMEHRGHIVTGMTNEIVWGVPHVFAVLLIVSASGALNIASLSSVFNKPAYKPYARLSGLLAFALLIGGLAVLVLDLGRPDRLTVAMTNYNFRSIFAWNIFLYVGFLAIVGTYLFTMMDRRASRSILLSKAVGVLGFVWRLVLTTGTGAIFGWLVAREAYDAAIMAPLFIAASLLYGLAFTILVLEIMGRQARQEFMSGEMAGKLRSLLAIFALAVLYFTALHHLTKLYAGEHRRNRTLSAARRQALRRGILGRSNICRQRTTAGGPRRAEVRFEPHGDRDRLGAVPGRRPGADVCHHYRRPSLSAEPVPGHGSGERISRRPGSELQGLVAGDTAWAERTFHRHAPREHRRQAFAVSAKVGS